MYGHADGTIRNWRTEWQDRDDCYYDQLRITCQQDNRSNAQSYGWKISYNQPYSVNLAVATKMQKTLSKINRAMEKLEREYGHPESFEDYVIRVSRALKADSFVFDFNNHNNGCLDVGQYSYEREVSYAKHRIREMIFENLAALENPLAKTEDNA